MDLTKLDQSLFVFLHQLNLPVLNPIMILLSGHGIWIPVIFLVLYLAKRETPSLYFWSWVVFLICVFVATDASSSYVAKNLFTRLRPCREDFLEPFILRFGQKCGGRFGFVSSHASNAFAVCGFALFSLRKIPRTFKFCLVIFPFLVAWSRLYLGVHYPGDLIFGIILGLFWAKFLAKGYQSLKGPISLSSIW